MPRHQVPAANLHSVERSGDETPVKTIHTKVHNKLNLTVPVRTPTPSRAVPCSPRTQHEPRADSPTTASVIV